MRTSARAWIPAALAVQGLGLLFDFAWHALNPDFRAVTVDRMVTHLGTVHLPLYAGVLAVFLCTAWALVDQLKRSDTGVATWFAFAGALVATVGEGWHAYTHLQLTTHSGPIAGTVALIGFVIVVVAFVHPRLRRSPRGENGADHERAA